jgi:hypothetical protein
MLITLNTKIYNPQVNLIFAQPIHFLYLIKIAIILFKINMNSTTEPQNTMPTNLKVPLIEKNSKNSRNMPQILFIVIY